MSFNLVQEEVIANVKNVARQLGILKEEESDLYWSLWHFSYITYFIRLRFT